MPIVDAMVEAMHYLRMTARSGCPKLQPRRWARAAIFRRPCRRRLITSACGRLADDQRIFRVDLVGHAGAGGATLTAIGEIAATAEIRRGGRDRVVAARSVTPGQGAARQYRTWRRASVNRALSAAQPRVALGCRHCAGYVRCFRGCSPICLAPRRLPRRATGSAAIGSSAAAGDAARIAAQLAIACGPARRARQSPASRPVAPILEIAR